MPRGRPIKYTQLTCRKCLQTKDRGLFSTPTACTDCYVQRKPVPTEKECTGCKTTQPITAFWTTSSSNCKTCYAPTALAANRKHKYGVDDTVIQTYWEQQNGKCNICLSPFNTSGDAHVDHVHITGAVRGLLCRGCNTGIGSFLENPDSLVRAAEYVKKPGTIHNQRKRRLTQEEKERIFDNPEKKSLRQLAEEYGKSEGRIQNIRHEIRTLRKLTTQSGHTSPQVEPSPS
jgi:hypothetical protein